MIVVDAPVPTAGFTVTGAGDAAPTVWLADVAPARDPAWVACHAAWLTADERARAGRIGRAARRTQLLAGHVLLRRLVAALAGVAPASVDVAAEAGGRPTIASPAGWRASLAHSGDWVAALADRGDVDAGFDIERHEPRRDIRALVSAACGFAAASDADAYLAWAQREAEIKAGPAAPACWVATWNAHALAVCARAAPAVFRVELDAPHSPVALPVTWLRRDRLSPAVLPR